MLEIQAGFKGPHFCVANCLKSRIPQDCDVAGKLLPRWLVRKENMQSFQLGSFCKGAVRPKIIIMDSRL